MSTSGISFINPILVVSYPILPASSVKFTNSHRRLKFFSRLCSRFRSCHPHVTAGFGCGCPAGLHDLRHSQTVVRTWRCFAVIHLAPFARLAGAGYQHFCSLLQFLKAVVVGQLRDCWIDCWHNNFSFFSRHFFDNKLGSLQEMTRRSVYHVASSKTCFVKTTLSVS